MIAATSWDPRFPPSTVFRHGGNKIGESRIWVSTGLCPQIITFSLICSWRINRIEVDCVGFHSLQVRNESPFKSPSAQRIQLIKSDKGYINFNSPQTSLSDIVTFDSHFIYKAPSSRSETSSLLGHTFSIELIGCATAFGSVSHVRLYGMPDNAPEVVPPSRQASFVTEQFKVISALSQGDSNAGMPKSSGCGNSFYDA